ncbi:hypothetical protein B9Z51_10055 [Limnohabitans sp. T6-5]|nr:hypothetical protein B9Z51_10055 [Limnohabitans sp. T6-5]
MASADLSNALATKAAVPANAQKTSKPSRKSTAKSPASKTRVKTATTPGAAKKAQATQKSPSTKVARPATKTVPSENAPPSKVKAGKEKKIKIVRDNFTLPKTELAQLADMKKRALTLGMVSKKSELIRAGLQLLSGSPDLAFKKALTDVPTIKTGRNRKG